MGAPGDDAAAEHSLSTHFFSSPVAPAQFTGLFREELRDGSLMIAAEVEVQQAGTYTIEGNLLTAGGDEAGEPVAFARAEAKLKTGRHFVELEYFGKVLHDRNLNGPYLLVGLRGSLNTAVIQPEMLAKSPEEVARFLKTVRDDRPKRAVIPYHAKSYKTAKYRASSFSGAVYSSAQKEQRLAQLRALPGGEAKGNRTDSSHCIPDSLPLVVRLFDLR